ncbi:MAG: hypothetical protein HC944_03030 [Nanoarchaeota archaeon]|nr:hypothetical protein [Nanoarchaeota archaeon]
MKFIVILILFSISVVPVAYGSEILATPKSELFGPNDWITIFVVVDGYAGGPVTWDATQPDGKVISGSLPSLQASKATHNIIRTAFDNQFGNWTVVYNYKDVQKSIDVSVEPLSVIITTDKDTYSKYDMATVQFSTNYYEPSAAKAETLYVNIVDEDGIQAKLVEEFKTKVSQASLIQQFSMDNFIKHNPSGTYHIIAKYYSVEVDVPFTISAVNSKTNIFLGSDKNLYDPGDDVEINIVVPEISANSGILTITYPSGKTNSTTISPVNPLNRIKYEGITNSEIGTFSAKFVYGTNVATKTFDVAAESLNKPIYKSETVAEDIVIPQWIRNNADWWSQNQITDYDFINAIQFMIREKIIVIPVLPNADSAVTEIPSWIKNNAKFWVNGEITDQEFAKSIAFLITSGIIKI